MPCGTGKSLTAFWITKTLNSKKIIIAVPSLALFSETLKCGLENFFNNNIDADWFCVCSDTTVKENQDEMVSLAADLGIKVDTDPRKIRNFLRKKPKKLKLYSQHINQEKQHQLAPKALNLILELWMKPIKLWAQTKN